MRNRARDPQRDRLRALLMLPVLLGLLGADGGDRVGLTIPRVTVSRDDGVYECFPDVARDPESGRLICVYRESEGHVPRDVSRLVVRESRDEGRTWSDAEELARIDRQPEETFWFPYNCPRITRLEDGRWVIVCDRNRRGEGIESQGAFVVLWFSDDGTTWSGPHETGIPGIVPDRLLVLDDGTWLIGTHRRVDEVGKLGQFVSASRDEGRTWSEPIPITVDPRYNACEVSIVPLDDGRLVAYMRENSGQGLPALKSLSTDHGQSWSEPAMTLLGAAHRPVAGRLQSGNILITYRHQPGGRGSWAKNLFAFLESQESAGELDRARQQGATLPIDHDRSPRSDSAYSGWVQLDDGTIFVVYYINDDAPKAQIRGAYLREEDF